MSSRQRKTPTRLPEQESPEFGGNTREHQEDHNFSLNKNLFNTLFRPVFDTKSKSDSPFGFNIKSNNPFNEILGSNYTTTNNAKGIRRNKSNSKRKLFEDEIS